MSWSIFDAYGRRKYLNRLEVERLLAQAIGETAEIYAFCRLLTEAGCRISEALAVTGERIDLDSNVIVFESLKKRRRGVFRAVPITPVLAELLVNLAKRRAPDRIWTWSRMTAWRHIHRLLDAAEISGVQASPKGLRHGFAVGALGSGVPLTLVQRWLGHADIRTTAIYADAAGPEELQFAQKLRSHYLAPLEAQRPHLTATTPWEGSNG